LAAICAEPTRANIHWNNGEALFVYQSAVVTERQGSRVHVVLNGEDSVFHRPHPGKELSESGFRSVREFVENAGWQWLAVVIQSGRPLPWGLPRHHRRGPIEAIERTQEPAYAAGSSTAPSPWPH
jgi:hypothetical protein